MQKSNFGMIGLGVMGRNLLLNIADKGFSVSGYDKNIDQVNRLSDEGQNKNIQSFGNLSDFINSLESPKKIMLLVPAGKIVDLVLDEIITYCEPNDIIIDGGNSHYTDTELRIEKLSKLNIHFIGMGVSGGEEGARYGPSMMPGGTISSFEVLNPIFLKISAQTNEGACVAHMGNGSAGHYIKMVHNGIEYAMMQLISEIYAILKSIGSFTNEELSKIFSDFNQSELNSFLIQITSDIFLKKDQASQNSYLLDSILDKAAQKGTGTWTSKSALELQIPIPSIDTSVSSRYLSTFKNERLIISTFKENRRFSKKINQKKLIIWCKNALLFGFKMSYTQGLHLIKTASKSFQFETHLPNVIKVWKGGCIIQSTVLNEIHDVYNRQVEKENLLLDEIYYRSCSSLRNDLTKTIKNAMKYQIGVPALSSALAYFDTFSTQNMPTNLIQAQRDFFGAHTFERIDQPGSFHENWN